jgi:hypothetical protein
MMRSKWPSSGAQHTLVILSLAKDLLLFSFASR